MEVITRQHWRIPVFSWCENIEHAAMEQFDHLAQLEFAKHYVIALPDTHKGFGMPIGAVIACEDVIIPHAVGSDISCGMLAVETSIKELEETEIKAIMGKIRDRIPMGRDSRKKPLADMPSGDIDNLPVVRSQKSRAVLQIGTLGGGNHFLELQRDETGAVWFMIHSGSRNLGKQIGDHYNNTAKELNKKYRATVPPSWDLAFLPMDSDEGKLYYAEMLYAEDYAQLNRDTMAQQIREAILEVKPGTEFKPTINISHNYAAYETIKGKALLVHRKGATSARLGEVGIIPGSQGSMSYIVRGLGNSKSYESCSHGAGRKLPRNEAKRTLSLETELAQMSRMGVVHGMRQVADLDEAPGAYKDIHDVMRQQEDLVEIVHSLRPIGNVKK